MKEIYEVLSNANKKNEYYESNISNININDSVIISNENGLEFGKVLSKCEKIKKNQISGNILRKVNRKDEKKIKKNNIDSQVAYIKCKELVKKNKLNMKLVNAKYTYDRSQLIFKFTSEDRVDFRNLAKELANNFKTRIELRQIGVRDKTKELGGCGQCGQELCCKRFLNEFTTVSINMAKDQDIALNPNKINGICGRLLCCLKYEEECYKFNRKMLPKIGSTVDTKYGSGKVTKIDILKRKYFIEVKEKGIIECEINESIK